MVPSTSLPTSLNLATSGVKDQYPASKMESTISTTDHHTMPGLPVSMRSHSDSGLGHLPSLDSCWVSLPVFNTRKNIYLSKQEYIKFNITKPINKDDLETSVSSKLGISPKNVYIYEEDGQKEETLKKSYVIVTPDNCYGEFRYLFIECLEFIEQTHVILLCARLPIDMTFGEVAKKVTEEFDWKRVGVCKDCNVLDDRRTIVESGLEDFESIQVIQSSMRPIKFVYQPTQEIDVSFTLEVNISSSVKEVQANFMSEFGKNVKMYRANERQTARFFYRNKLLDDEACIGYVLRGGKEDTFRVYFATRNATNLRLKFKDLKTKKKEYGEKQIFIEPNVPTSALRAEIALHLRIDPKAVKMTVNGRRIEECENVQDENILENEFVVTAGIKKQKSLRVKHPKTKREVVVKIYMLEQVRVLKENIADELGIDVLQVSLKCRNTKMQDKELLQNYAIKNNMELAMQLFEHRIRICVLLRGENINTTIVIDDSKSTTVDDLLYYCAHKFEYQRVCSRGIYKQRCLNKNLTLAAEGIMNGATLMIVQFDPPEILPGDLIRVFEIYPDGELKKRLGAVHSQHLLLHASEDVLESNGRKTELNNGSMPHGIHISDVLVPRVRAKLPAHIQVVLPIKAVTSTIDEKIQSAQSENIEDLKKKYLPRAKAVYKKMRNKLVVKKHRIEGSDRNKPGRPSFYLHQRSEDMSWNELDNSDYCKSLQQKSDTDDSCSLKGILTVETDGDLKHSENGDYVRCIRNCSQKLLQFEQQNREGFTCTSQSSAAISANENYCSSAEDTCLKNVNVGDNNMTLNDITETGICRRKHSETHENYQPGLTDTSNGIDLFGGFYDRNTTDPYQKCPFVRKHLKYHIRKLREDRSRRRTYTNGELELRHSENLEMQLPLNWTFPMLTNYQTDDHLNTSGITVDMLAQASFLIGDKWKRLAMKLGLDISTIEHIEHDNSKLMARSFEALLYWKRLKGHSASKHELVKGLEEIDMKSVAEMCEQTGYNTV